MITNIGGQVQVVFEVQTITGRAASACFRIGQDWVEIWLAGRCRGVLSRAAMAAWLAGPGDPITTGDVTLTLDLLIDRDRGRISVTLPEVTAWALSPGTEAQLREHAGRR